MKTVSQSLDNVQTSVQKFKEEQRVMLRQRRESTADNRLKKQVSVSSPEPINPYRNFQPRMGRRESILEQAEAKHASFSRNAVKKRMLSNFNRRISIAKNDDEIENKDWESIRRLSYVSKCSTITSFVSLDRNTSIRSIRSGHKEKEEAKPSDEYTENVRKRPPLTLQRSVTLDSFVKQSPTKRRKSIKLPRLGLLSDDDKEKKKMKKLWGNAYTGMCNRAVVLNHAILQADKEEIAVKPINSSCVYDEMPSEEEETKNKKLFIGLSQQFYHISDGVNSSDEDISVMSNVGTTDADVPKVMTANAKEIPYTEEVLLTVRRNNSPDVRLNLRTRSVDTLYVHRHPNEEDMSSPTTPIYHSRKSIFDASSPSHIPRLRNKDHDNDNENDIACYLDLDVDNPVVCHRNETQTQTYKKTKSRHSPNSVADNSRLLGTLFRSRSDASTQVNFPVLVVSSRSDSPESRPLERQIEARSGSEDGQGSMVRCLHFANTFIANRK